MGTICLRNFSTFPFPTQNQHRHHPFFSSVSWRMACGIANANIWIKECIVNKRYFYLPGKSWRRWTSADRKNIQNTIQPFLKTAIVLTTTWGFCLISAKKTFCFKSQRFLTNLWKQGNGASFLRILNPVLLFFFWPFFILTLFKILFRFSSSFSRGFHVGRIFFCPLSCWFEIQSRLECGLSRRQSYEKVKLIIVLSFW